MGSPTRKSSSLCFKVYPKKRETGLVQPVSSLKNFKKKGLSEYIKTTINMIDHHVRYENDHRFYGTRKIIPFKKW
jgi:hypothetical protein